MCENLILVISHLFALRRSFLVRKNLSFGFYESHIKNFSVWNVGHHFARWPALASQHVANKIFLDLRPEVFHTGVLDVRYTQLFVLKGHVLWGPILVYFCCFPETSELMRCTTISSETALSSPAFLPFLFAFCTAAYLRHSAILTRTATTNYTRMGLWE